MTRSTERAARACGALVAIFAAGCGTSSPTDAAVDAGPEVIEEIAATTSYDAVVCVRTNVGAVHCRNGDIGESFTPLTRDATQISVDGVTGCARMRDGTARCWKNVSLTSSRLWLAMDTGLRDVVRVTGGTNGCALLANGETWCWDGVSAVGNGEFRLNPATRLNSATVAEVRIAGDHRFMRFMDGHVEDNGLPAPGATNVALFAGSSFGTCWIDRSGRAGCALTALPGMTIPPTDFSGLDGATSLAMSRQQVCGVVADHSVRCWGSGLAPGLGVDSSDFHWTDTVAPTGLGEVDEIVATTQSWCARRGGDVKRWGSWSEQLGDRAQTRFPVPVAVSFE